MKRKLVLVVTDWHSGHVLGLCSPDVRLEDPDTGEKTVIPSLTDTQRYLWDVYRDDVESARKWAGRDPVILLHLGDMTQGNKHPEQLMSNRRSDQVAIAVKSLELPLSRVQNVEAVRLVQGTSAHDPIGEMTILAAKDKDLYKLCRNIKTTIHTVMTVGGAKVDYTHPGPHPGGRKWLEGNIVRYNLRDMMLDDICYGIEPADVYLRGHRHTYRHEVVEIYGDPDRRSEMFSLPAYCGISYYARQAATKPRLTTCMLMLEIIDGKVGHQLFKRTLDARTKEAF